MKLFDVYSLYDIEPVMGKGNYVYTADGTEYLDLYGGHAVISVGHAHPHYVEAVSKQVAQLGFYSNSVENSLQVQFAEKLGKASAYDDYSLFLCNSGAEANENAIKLASFHSGKSKVLAFGKAFHGRTSGAVAATDNPKIVSPFNRTENVEFVPLNDIEAVKAKLATGEFCAVLIEGIQGVAGIHCPTVEFLQQLREATTEYGVSLILDEIQSGYGRTGDFFAHQHAGIRISEPEPSISIPIIKPRPRTSFNCGILRSSAMRYSPTSRAFATRFSFSKMSSTAIAAAQARWLPPNVVPSIPFVASK